MQMQKLLLLAAAGALGTMARYGVSGAAQRILGGEFPWGTLAANLIGCFLAGVFWSVAESRLSISGQTRTIVLMGFMGAFTTFSAFMLETGQLVRDAQWSWALGNVALQNGCGFVLFFCGLAVGRLI
jgi:CrcB protein